MPVEDIAVVMTNFNHARYLPRAVRAVLGQTVRPREFFVLDDGSTDDSLAVLDALAREDPLVTVVRNDRNRGVIATVNRGVALASTEYLMLAASDDYVLPQMIEKSVGLLRRHPRADISCAYHSTADEDTGEVSPNPSGWADAPRYFTPAEFADVVGPTGIPSTSAVYRRAAFVRAGSYHPDLKWSTDWFLNLVVAFRGGLCHVPEPLAIVVTKAGSYSAAMHDPAARRPVLSAVLDRVLSAEYADVLPHFRASGVLAALGIDLVRAAAARPDLGSPDVIALLRGFRPDEYEPLLVDPDSDVRELAAVLIGPMWRRRKADRDHADALYRAACAERDETARAAKVQADSARAEYDALAARLIEAERQTAFARSDANHLQEVARDQATQLAAARDRIAGMESTKLWKLRTKLAGLKGSLARLARPRVGR